MPDEPELEEQELTEEEAREQSLEQAQINAIKGRREEQKRKAQAPAEPEE